MSFQQVGGGEVLSKLALPHASRTVETFRLYATKLHSLVTKNQNIVRNEKKEDCIIIEERLVREECDRPFKHIQVRFLSEP